MTERPLNIRAARVLERSYANGGHHGRHPVPEARGRESRADDNQIGGRSYRGSHRAAGQHHADRPTPAQQRDSRVGRHHAHHRPSDPSRADSSRADSSRADSSRADSSRADSSRADPSRGDSDDADQGRTDSSRADRARAGRDHPGRDHADDGDAGDDQAEDNRADSDQD